MLSENWRSDTLWSLNKRFGDLHIPVMFRDPGEFVRTYIGGAIVNRRADRGHNGEKDDRGDHASPTLDAA
jgi:hypothetical protein